MKKIVAIINGYGVPKDIFNDLSYHAYLVQVFNYLFEKYHGVEILLVPCGGKVSYFPPYDRTEGGEMAKWLRARIKKINLKWRVAPKVSGITALENLLACKNLAKGKEFFYFCEKTRLRKMRILVGKILRRGAKVVGIEFDGSPSRYQFGERKVMEKEDLQYSLLALKNAGWKKLLHRAAEEKIEVLRKTSPRVRAEEINRITRRIRQKYFEKFNKNQLTN